MNLEKNPQEIIPEPQKIPEKEKQVPIEVIDETLKHLNDEWEENVGEYKGPSSDKLQ